MQDFEVDEFSQEYKALHPMPSTTKKPSLLEEHFEAPSEEEDEQSISGSDVPSEDDLEDTNGKSKRKARGPRSDVLLILSRFHSIIFHSCRLFYFMLFGWFYGILLSIKCTKLIMHG